MCGGTTYDVTVQDFGLIAHKFQPSNFARTEPVGHNSHERISDSDAAATATAATTRLSAADGHMLTVAGKRASRWSLPWCVAMTIMGVLNGCRLFSSSGDESRPELVWEASASARDLFVNQAPYVDQGIAVFTSDGHRVFAFHPTTGQQLWTRQLAPPGDPALSRLPPSNIVGVDDLIIVSGYNLYALDRATGAMRWTYEGNDEVTSASGVALNGSTVYASGGTRYLSAIDIRTGALRWRADLGERPFSPLVVNGRVYVGAKRRVDPDDDFGFLGIGHLWALDAETGAVLWRTLIGNPEIPNLGGVVARPGLFGNVLVVAGSAGHIVGLDRETGAVLWEQHRANEAYHAGIVAALDSVAVVAGITSAVLGLDPLTGRILWERSIGSGTTGMWSTSGDVVLITNGRVVAVDATGSIRWRFPPQYSGTAFTGGATYNNGLVYAGGYAENKVEFIAVRPPR